MYVGGTYARLVYNWYQNMFHVIAILIVLHAANGEKRMKTILKQDSKSRQRQDIVPVSNLKARKIRTLLSLPIHLYHHPIAAAAVTPLSLRCLSAAFAPAVVKLSLLLSPQQLFRCRSAVAPMSLRCCSCCHSAVAPLSLCSRFCRSVAAAVAPAVATLSLLISLLMSLHCHSCCRPGVAPLSFRYHSAVAPLLLRCR